MAEEELVARLRASGVGGFRRAMNGAATDVRGVGRAAQTAGSVGAAGMGRLSSATSGAATAAKTLIGVYAGMKIVGGLKAAAAAGFEFNRTIDSQRIGFTTMLGSQEEARDMMREIQGLAMRSPILDPKSTGEAARRLMAFGVAQGSVIEYTEALGDMAAATGNSIQEVLPMGARALGQIASKGKLQTEELNQLAESVGLSRKAIRKELGMTVEEFESTFTPGNNIMADKALPAIIRAMRKQSGGAAKALSETTAGEIDAARERFAKRMGQVTRPIYDAAGDVIGNVSKDLDRIWGRSYDVQTKFEMSEAAIRENLAPVARQLKTFWVANDVGGTISRAFESTMSTLATKAGDAAPRVAMSFARAWWDAGVWGKLVTGAWLVSKLGGFRLAGAILAGRFAGGFSGSMKGGKAGATMTTAATTKGRSMGRVMGKAMAIGAGLSIGFWLKDQLDKPIQDVAQWLADRITGEAPEGFKTPEESEATLRRRSQEAGRSLDDASKGPPIVLPGGPAPRRRKAKPRARGATYRAPSMSLTVPVTLDRRELGRGTARIAADDLARS